MTQTPVSKSDRREYYREYRNRNKHKRKRVTVTLTIEEFGVFDRLAKTEHRSLPEQIKVLALAEISKTRPAPRELVETVNNTVRELRRIGNNVNQLTKRVHAESGLFFRKHLRYAPELLRKTIDELNRIENTVRESLNIFNK